MHFDLFNYFVKFISQTLKSIIYESNISDFFYYQTVKSKSLDFYYYMYYKKDSSSILHQAINL